MKKTVIVIISLLFAFSLNIQCYATDDFSDEITDRLFSSLDGEVSEALEDFGVSDLDSDKIFDISLENVFLYFKNNINVLLTDSIRMFSQIFALILVAGIIGMLIDNKEYKRFLNVIAAASVILIIVYKINLCISSAASLLKLNNSFMLCFAPIYAVVITASGNPSLALTYNSVVLGLSELVSFLINYGFIDVLGCYFCICVTMPINKDIDYLKIISAVNRVSTFILGLLSSVFASVLTLKGVTAAATDSVASKGVRFAVGSLIPVIGSSINEAYSALLGSINIIKGSVAIVGIIAVLIINIPVIIEILMFNISLNALSYFSGILDCTELTDILKGFAGGIKLLGLLVIFEMLVFIVSTSVMLSVKGG